VKLTQRKIKTKKKDRRAIEISKNRHNKRRKSEDKRLTGS